MSDGSGWARRAVLASAAGLPLVRPAAAAAAALAQREPRLVAPQRTWSDPPPLPPLTEGMAQAPGARLYYSDTGGSGEPIVLLHPATGSALIWAHQQAAFARAGYRVVAYSRRGHARSETGPMDRTGSAVEDLAALLAHLKIGRFHVVGSAAGGFLAPDFAVSYPERLLSMTLACSQGGVVDAAYRQAIAALTAEPFASLPASMRELGPSYRAANPAGVARWEALEHMALTAGRRVNQTPTNTLGWDAIARIRTPTLLIAGGADLYMPPTLALEYASHLPNARTAIISECGHSAYWEQPAAFNRLVLDFLRRPGRR